MGLKDKLQREDFAITSEMAPPKGIDMEHFIKCARSIRGRVDAVNVTDFQSAVVRVSSLGACKILLEEGIEPVLQITGRDRNRIAIQGELLSAGVFGIKNVLALTGDHPAVGDHPSAKAVYDMDSVNVLQTASKLMAGEDLSGHELKGTPDYFLGASVTPLFDPVELQILKMKKKIHAGARFFQTQAVYDIDVLKDFMAKIKDIAAKVLVGVIPLKSAGMARYMNNNVPGIRVPDEIIERMKNAEDKTQEGLNIAKEFIKVVKEEEVCAGVHIMAIGAEENVPILLDMCGF